MCVCVCVSTDGVAADSFAKSTHVLAKGPDRGKIISVFGNMREWQDTTAESTVIDNGSYDVHMITTLYVKSEADPAWGLSHGVGAGAYQPNLR